jgi:hypothetical protein
MVPLTAYDSKLSPAQVALAGHGAVVRVDSTSLDARVKASSQSAIASVAADGSSMSHEAVASLCLEYGLHSTPSKPEPARGKMPMSEEQLWMRAYEGGKGAASSAGGSSMPSEAASPRRVRFSSDTKGEKAFKKPMVSSAEAEAKNKLETFDTLTTPNPSQQKIAKLFENQLAIGLWNSRLTEYRDDEGLFPTHRLSIETIAGAFYHILNSAVEEVARTKKVESGFLYIDEYLGDVLDKAFTPDEEFSDQRSIDAFFSRHDMEVLGLCFPIMSEMLDHRPVRHVLHAFFSRNLE